MFHTSNGGDSWEASQGLPGPHAYAGVLRGAMDTDHLDPEGFLPRHKLRARFMRRTTMEIPGPPCPAGYPESSAFPHSSGRIEWRQSKSNSRRS